MAYSVHVVKSAKKELAALAKRDQRRIVKAIAALAEEPRPNGVRKMHGSEEAYRIRVGDYRIIYQIFDKKLVVRVIRVGNRKDVYRR